ncbi:hypothetical protein [Lacticaseibacillus songhuajiangensis]|jgi:hypothetical protein|uniref:hypothetical protein n=1 Tax=Lacticaseibacillus songhuajiangensis TaxID=1296539 RepID=UPI000F77CD01|nr:hypothetical protein [Lacticaseibacillus songhuajiangensis]
MDEKERQLRMQIATISDQLMSERYTEDQVEKRYDEWRRGSIEAPTAAEEHAFSMSEAREFTEELLVRVLLAKDDTDND